MDKNGRLPLQLNIDTSFLYRDTLVPHPGIVKPSLCISRPGGLGLGTLPPVVTPTIISHLPRPTIHESNNNAGPLPIPRKDAKTDVEVKKSNSSCKNPSPVGNDVCELQVTVTPLNPFMLSTGPSSCSIIGSTTHNIRIYNNNNNSDVYTNSYQRRTKHFPQAYIGAPKDGKCAVCKVVPFQFHHFGAFVCNRCRAFFRRTVRRERRGCNLAPCLMTRKVVHNPYTHEPVCDIGVFRGACQVCRYVMCLRAGMNAKSVLSDTDRILKFPKRNARKIRLSKKKSDKKLIDNESDYDVDFENDDSSLCQAEPFGQNVQFHPEAFSTDQSMPDHSFQSLPSAQDFGQPSSSYCEDDATSDVENEQQQMQDFQPFQNFSPSVDNVGVQNPTQPLSTLSNYMDMGQSFNANSILQLMYYEHAVNSPPWLSNDSEPAEPLTSLPVNPPEPENNPVESAPVEQTIEISDDLSNIEFPDILSNYLVKDDETSNDTAFTTTAETTPSSSMSPSLSDIAFDGDDISIDDDFSFIKVEDDFLTSVVTSESSPDDRSGMVQTPDLFLGLLDDESLNDSYEFLSFDVFDLAGCDDLDIGNQDS